MANNKSKQKNIKYGDCDFIAIDEAKLKRESDKEIKIKGHISQISDSLFERKKNENDVFEGRGVIVDETGSISTTYLSKKTFLALKKLQENGKPIIILGHIVRMPAYRKPRYVENCIEIDDYRVLKSPLSIISAKKKEKELVKNFLKSLKSEKLALFDALKEAAVEEYGIDLKNNKSLSVALDVAIIQAFSSGRVQNTSGKINTLIIGGSGKGKKLIWYTAKLFNVLSGQADSGRISPAGLTADLSKQTVDGSIKLGLLPKANKGIAGFEDFDKCHNQDVLYPIISPVMENGECVITVRENMTLEAETAIHIDVNPKSSQAVARTGIKAIIDDIGMDPYMLSRFDYISYMPSSGDDDEDEMEPTKKSKIHKYCRNNKIDFKRFNKLLVAYIQSKYPIIDISAVAEYRQKKFIKMINKFDVKEIFGTYRRRMRNSRDKFIMALARLQMRESGNKRAVNLTIKYLSEKMKFLELVNQDSKVKVYEKGESGFIQYVYDKYGHRFFSITSLRAQYKKDGYPCGEPSIKTIYNWLNEHADSDKHDEWKLKQTVIYRLS